MALAGTALLALWNDIARAREPEYDRWHSLEHVPERVSVAGFRGARRYVARGRDTERYFTLYDVADAAVFESAEYRELLAQPTPWSASMRPDFANVVRVPCTVDATFGPGIGAALAVLGLPAIDDAIVDEAVAAAMKLDGSVGATTARPVPGTPPPAWRGAAGAGDPVAEFAWLVFVEALDRASAESALASLRTRCDAGMRAAGFANDVYDLAFVFPAHDPGEPARHRRTHWAPR